MTRLESNIQDQAKSLRMAAKNRRSAMSGITRVISFTSGKGGVGKTHTIVNTAIALAKRGKSVLLLDADLGLANVNVLLGLQPKYTLHDVFQGKKSLRDILITGPEGISIIPAASGVESICELNAPQKLSLMQGIEDVAHSFDYLLIDTRAGIGSDVMFFNTASSEIICVINNEPTSLTDAYATIKVLATQYGEKKVSVVANKVIDESDGLKAFNRLSRVVTKFLQTELKYLGHIPADQAVIQSIQSQKSVQDLFPTSTVTKAFNKLAQRVDEEFLENRVKGGMQFFFEQILSVG
jgi:flagellar biosynthesis protein FlhG